MAYNASLRGRARQDWTIGQTVSVGFLRDLEVVEKVPTPGDYAPDAYVLRKFTRTAVGNGRGLSITPDYTYYRFVPHKGIERRQSLADAREA